MENIQFENKYELTKALLKSYRYKYSQIRWLEVFLMVTDVLFIIICVYGIINFNSYIFIFGALLFSYFLLTRLFGTSFSVRQQLKEHTRTTDEESYYHTIRFGENIEIQNGNINLTYLYNKVRFIKEDKENFVLLINTDMQIIVRKNSFIIGSEREFREFIYEKCSEQQPLWTNGYINKRMFIKRIPAFICLIIISVIIVRSFLLIFSPLNLSGYATQVWGEDVRYLTSVKIEGGAVMFGTDDVDEIYAGLLKKTGNRLRYIDGHSLSVTAIHKYNSNHDKLFETEKDLLYLYQGEALVYSVVNAEWSRHNRALLDDYGHYKAFDFECDGIKYIVLFKIVN